MKKAKRALALALVFALVASFCVTGAAAAPGQGDIVYGSYDNGNWAQTEGGNGSSTETVGESQVTVSKTAEAVSGEDNQYEVTLKVKVPVTTNTKSASAATVLVIDRSLSMDYCAECGGESEHKSECSYTEGRTQDWISEFFGGGHWGYKVKTVDTRLYAAKTAACNFLDSYAEPNSNSLRYVAVVAFAGSAYTPVDWVNVNNSSALQEAKNTIWDIDTASSTDLYDGLDEAEGLLNNNDIRNVEKRFVIALTDGSPTENKQGAVTKANEIKTDGNRSATIYTVCFGASDDSFYWQPDGDWQETTVSEYLSGYIATSGSTAFDAADADELYAAFEALTEDIEDSLERLTVTDPMATGVSLDTNFGNDNSVSVENDDTITWRLNNGEKNGDTITYTLSYTVTVNPDDFKDQKAGYYPLNGETYLSIPAQDEWDTESTVQFPVPGVYVTPTSSTEEQDVYVYVKVVGKNGADGNLTQDELEQAHAWGLTTLNNSGWYTIGVVYNCLLPPIPDPYDPNNNIYSEYKDAVDLNSLIRFENNKGFDITGVNWNDLHVADGADDYKESGTPCWHLDGIITLEQLEQRLVTVTYTDGVDGEEVFKDQVYDRIPGTATPEFVAVDGSNTPSRDGYTFTGWDPEVVETVTGTVTYVAQWSLNTNKITIQVYVDGSKTPVELTEGTLSQYITSLENGDNTQSWRHEVNEDGDIVGTYSYRNYDSADIVLTPNGNYVLQGIEGTFIQGSQAWQGITQSDDGWKIDNVKGGSTLKVYLNTKYSVEYVVPDGFEAPEADNNTYITVEGLQDVSAPNFDGVTDGNTGVSGGWTNSSLSTTITLSKDLPDGTTGWYDELTQAGQHKEGETIIVAEAVADKLNGDNNTFTFTAKANEYTVTYNDGVDGAEVFADQTYENLTYGEDTPDFLVDGSPADPEREGYTFTGWSPNVAEKVTGDATYTATWTADEDTAYKVEHYQEQLDGTFELSETDNLAGTTGEEVTATQKSYTGFTFDEDNEYNVKSGTIAGDGSLVLKLYYVRETYTVKYDANGGSGTMTDDNSPYKYGATVTVKDNGFTRENYEFTGWAFDAEGDEPAGETFTITENTTLYAQWEEITGTLTVTKTFSGLENNEQPTNFAITVENEDGETVATLGLSSDGVEVDGTTYTWTINELSLGEYTVSESGYAVDDYLCKSDGPKTVTISAAEGASVTLTNIYTAISRELVVEKSVVSVGGVAVTEAVPEAKVDDTIIYKIVVTNNSNVALENISVKDELAGQLYTDESCETEATLPIASLEANGGRATFYAKYTVQAADAGTKLTNTATAEDEDGTEDSGEVTVNVTPQYKVDVVYHYDTVDGTTFMPPSGTQTVFIYDAGDNWSITNMPTSVEDDDGVNYIFDASRSDTTSGENISENVTVDLVYVKDEWDDEDDSETGGDGTPDYKQAVIKYVADPAGSGTVSNEIDVVTLDEDENGEYKDNVKANSTATAGEGYVFTSWTGPEGYTSDEAQLSHTFTAEGGETYTYTASFKTGTTDAEVTKTLVSYTRDDVTVDEIPEGFKARVGDVLNYKITIKNIGDIALDDVTVSDSLWDEGKVETALVGGTGTNVTSGSCKVDVASGSSVTITYSYTVQADDIGRTITNTATVDMGDEVPGDDPKDDEEVTVDDYSVTITPADIVAYTGGDGYSAVVGEDNQYINDSTSGLPEPGYHVVLSDAVVDWLNDNGVAAGDGLTDDATDLADVLSFTYNYGGKERAWSLQYVGVYSYNASGNPSAYVYSIVTETAGAPSVSLKYFDDLNGDGEADDNEVITSDDILMSADQVNHTYKMTIEGGDLNQSQVKAVLKAGESSLTTDIEIGIGELTVLSTTNEETTNSIADSAAGVDSGVITAVGSDSITYYVNESGVAFDEGDLVSRVQLLIDEVTNETSGEFETAMAEAAFDAISADLRNAEYEMCYMDLVDTENGNAKVTFSGGELSIYWPLPDGASASDSFYIVHFTELDREHAAVGTDVLDTTNKDVIAGEVMRIGGEYYVTFDVGSFSPFVLVYGDDGGDKPWWPPIGPGDDDDDGDDDVDREFVPKWLNIDDHYAYIIGYEDGTVRPQGNITRAEVATIFFRLLTDEVREEYWSTESGYTDVKAGDWYNNAISTLSNLGVITGYEDGTFRPNASISRAEFVTIATRFFDYTAEYEGTFSDVSYSSWYADFVQAAVDMGLVNGYENGTFRPNASITRAEAVAIVNRVLLRRPDAEHLLPWSVMNTFSDNVLESAWYYEDIQEATNSHDYEWLKSGVEDWTEKLPERDWAALEREWSSAYDAPGGEVTG